MEDKKLKTVLVSGIARSGLTATMHLLQKGGFPCLGTFPGFEDFAPGTIDWKKAEGKAVKLVDVQRQFPPKGDYKVIRLKRDLRQQANSMRKIMNLLGFDIPRSQRKEIEKSLKNDYSTIDKWVSFQPENITIQFEDIIQNTDKVVERLSEFLEFELKEDAAKAILQRTTDSYNGMLEEKFMLSNDSLELLKKLD